jgi:hypothetical protein
MGRTHAITAAILLSTVSWVWAGTFDVLADAKASETPAPLVLTSGGVVKPQFKSDVDNDDNNEMLNESDAPTSDVGSAASALRVKPRPASAYKEKSRRGAGDATRGGKSGAGSGGAPSEQKGSAAQSSDPSDDMDLDLEKDLVLTPPPPKAEEKPEPRSKPAIDTKGQSVGDAVKKAESEGKRPAVKAKSPAPLKIDQYAQSGKPIRKVRPLSQQGAWGVPAGSHGGPERGATEEPSIRDAQGRIAPPPAIRRFVQDGVTVKLTQQPAPGAQQITPEQGDGDSLMSMAADVIGLPFAFISSLF